MRFCNKRYWLPWTGVKKNKLNYISSFTLETDYYWLQCRPKSQDKIHYFGKWQEYILSFIVIGLGMFAMKWPLLRTEN